MFVSLFKQYCSLCPLDRPDDAFYLSPLKNFTEKCWYSRAPVGHNTLKNFVSKLCKEAGIQGYKTNHSLRATAATRLYESGVDEQLVVERTGLRSLEGVWSYKRTSTEQQQDVSDILSNSKRPCVNREVVPLQPSTGSQATNQTTSNLCLPNIVTDSSSGKQNGAFHLNSCSNIIFNFNYTNEAK